jgi:hypothetical protein
MLDSVADTLLFGSSLIGCHFSVQVGHGRGVRCLTLKDFLKTECLVNPEEA